MKKLVNIISMILSLSSLFCSCAFDASLKVLNSAIWDKSLQFEKQALDKIEEAIKHIEGEHKDCRSAEQAFLGAVKLEEKALRTLRDIAIDVEQYLQEYPTYTRYLYSYADCKKLQDKLVVELEFKSKNDRVFFDAISYCCEKEKQQENKNELEQ